MGFIFLLTCFFFYKYEIKSIIEKLKKKELTLSTFDSYKQIKVADRTCAKCHEKISNLINHPCGHLNLCDECGSRSEKCYECKKRPKEQFQVYPSWEWWFIWVRFWKVANYYNDKFELKKWLNLRKCRNFTPKRNERIPTTKGKNPLSASLMKIIAEKISPVSWS